MGWRISFYLVTKKMADKIKNMTEEEYHKNEVRLCRNLGKKCIWYDTMTDLRNKNFRQNYSHSKQMIYITARYLKIS